MRLLSRAVSAWYPGWDKCGRSRNKAGDFVGSSLEVPRSPLLESNRMISRSGFPNPHLVDFHHILETADAIARSLWQQAFDDARSFGQAGAFPGHPETWDVELGIHLPRPWVAFDGDIAGVPAVDREHRFL